MKMIIKTFMLLSFIAFLISSANYIQELFGWDLGIVAWFAALTGIFVGIYMVLYNEK